MDPVALFPDGTAFRPRMGVEVYEHYTCVRELVDHHDSTLGADLAAEVLYGTGNGLDDDRRAAAVLTMSVAIQMVYSRTYRRPTRSLAGTGVGVLAAGVVSGAISLRRALRTVVRHEPLPSALRVTTAIIDPRSGIEATAPRDVDAALAAWRDAWDAPVVADALWGLRCDRLVDMGPGRHASAELRPHLAPRTIVACMDHPENQAWITDSLNERKFFRPAHVADRMRGLIAGTPNRSDDPADFQRVREMFEEIKYIGEKLESVMDTRHPIEDDSALARVCRLGLLALTAKGMTDEEIERSFTFVEETTLVPVLELAGMVPRAVPRMTVTMLGSA